MAGGFDSLGLMPELLRSVNDLGWILPTDVQDESIPLILGGGDVMVASETGSGKTAAFGLPILQCVYEKLKVVSKPSSKRFSPSDFVLSDQDKDSFVSLSESGLRCSSSAEKTWQGCRSSHGIKSGKYYYECNILGEGLCRFGFSTISGHLELGRDNYGFGYGGTAMKSHGNSFAPYGQKFGKNDVVTCLLDLQENSISYAKNGEFLGTAFSIPESLRGVSFFPAIAIKGGDFVVNFGTSTLKYPMESRGFHPIAHAKPDAIVGAKSSQSLDFSSKRCPLAVIIEPSRDLAEQVFRSLVDLAQHIASPSLKIGLFVGGDDGRKQQKMLAEGIDIAVGTTGKLVDLIHNQSLSLTRVKFFVLDEADRLIETDNLPSIMEIYSSCPTGGCGEDRLQVCFFSATLHSPAIKDLSQRICLNPIWVDLKGVDSVPDTVHHVVYRVDPHQDSWMLTSAKSLTIHDDVHVTNGKLTPEESKSLMIKNLKPQILLQIIDKFKMSQCMIFCRTNVDCDNLEKFLLAAGGGGKFKEKMETGKENPYSCCVLAGMRSMAERRQNLEAFKEGYIRFLICTDVAARGIDIANLPYMINMTLPDEPENYIHRIGRVGRADRMGLAISLVAAEDLKEKVWYHKCASRGKDCQRRQLVDQGGCTIWINESNYLRAIEDRLHMKVGCLSTKFDLPPELALLNVEYGEEVNNRSNEVNPHLELIAPTVKELAEMEMAAQNSYLLFRMKSS